MSPGFKPVLASLLVLSGVVLVGVVFMRNCERVPMEVELGPRAEARRNRLLACERFLTRLGLAVESAQRLMALKKMPPRSATVLAPGPRWTWSAKSLERARRWVIEGGHLVVSAATPLGRSERRPPDALLDPLGVEVVTLGPRGEVPGDAEDGGQVAGQGEDTVDEEAWAPSLSEDLSEEVAALVRRIARQTTEIDLPDAKGPLLVLTPGRFGLRDREARAVWAAPSEGEHFILQYALGKGMLTVVSNPAFLHNETIGSFDHAELVWRLVTFGGRDGGAALLHGYDVPSVWKLALERGWAVLLTFAVILIFYLWMKAPRFGPLLPSAQRPRRSVMEHVEATGKFLWRRRQAHVLLESARQGVLRKASRRIQRWQQLSQSEQRSRLADLSGVGEDQVRWALDGPRAGDPVHFTKAIERLERIRRAL